jgi:hypothetical protein
MHYEYGKSIILDQKDHFVYSGFLKNQMYDGLPEVLKEKIQELISLPTPIQNSLKIIITGIGSEFIQGLISQEKYKDFIKFKSNNQFGDDTEAWIEYLETIDKDSNPDQIKENYWDYNDVSHFTGIDLDDLIMEVYTKGNQLLYSTNYEDFKGENEDSVEQNSINSSNEYGKYFYPKTPECLVTYKSREKFTFTFQIENSTDFDPKKLGFQKVSTDEMGNGDDYGDYTIGIIYGDIVYDDLDQSTFGGSVSIYFEP